MLIITPYKVVIAVRLAGIVCFLALCVLTVGPFRGLERQFGLNDTAAHVIAFYGLTIIAFVVAPDRRRMDLAIILLSFGVAIEIVQAATGRSASVLDFLADAAGITAAIIPGFVNQLRRDARLYPFMSYADIKRMDRRQNRRPSAKKTSGETPYPAQNI